MSHRFHMQAHISTGMQRTHLFITLVTTLMKLFQTLLKDTHFLLQVSSPFVMCDLCVAPAVIFWGSQCPGGMQPCQLVYGITNPVTVIFIPHCSILGEFLAILISQASSRLGQWLVIHVQPTWQLGCQSGKSKSITSQNLPSIPQAV